MQTTLRAVLPGSIWITSTAAPGGHYVVAPAVAEGQLVGSSQISLLVNGVELATLEVIMHLATDASGDHLKTTRMGLKLFFLPERTPLVRLDYRADMHTAPITHWQIHAERGSFSHLLSRAHAVRPEVVRNPYLLSSLHLAVGGERFRPCLEDFLQFLVQECGVDSLDGWEEAVRDGREKWRRIQTRAVARDAQTEVAEVLRIAGWTVVPPDKTPADNLQKLTAY